MEIFEDREMVCFENFHRVEEIIKILKVNNNKRADFIMQFITNFSNNVTEPA